MIHPVLWPVLHAGQCAAWRSNNWFKALVLFQTPGHKRHYLKFLIGKFWKHSFFPISRLTSLHCATLLKKTGKSLKHLCYLDFALVAIQPSKCQNVESGLQSSQKLCDQESSQVGSQSADLSQRSDARLLQRPRKGCEVCRWRKRKSRIGIQIAAAAAKELMYLYLNQYYVIISSLTQ